MARKKIQYKYNDRQLKINVERVPEHLNKRVDAIFLRNEAYAEFWMKQHAPWTDRTGAARNGLFAQAFNAKDHKQLILAHSVEYGIYLETMESGQYQVINPAIRAVGAEIMKELEHVLDHV